MTRKRLKLTDDLRTAIAESGLGLHGLGRETDIDPATLCRFVHKQGGLSMDGLDRIADCLGLNIVAASKPRKSKGCNRRSAIQPVRR